MFEYCVKGLIKLICSPIFVIIIGLLLGIDIANSNEGFDNGTGIIEPLYVKFGNWYVNL